MACEMTLGGEASESIATTACALAFEQIGPYRVLRVIAAGGMGTVYEGLRTDIDRRVAIKVLHADIAGRPDAQARLYREASAVNRVGHPGLAEVSEVEPLPGGGLYLVMEFLRGETLAARLARCGGRLAIVDLLELGIRLADILTVAHRHGVIHRDVKPENLLLTSDAEPSPQMPALKLIDFGLAYVQSESERAKLPWPEQLTELDTQPGARIGTPQYRAPELGTESETDRDLQHQSPAIDAYALGCWPKQSLCAAHRKVVDERSTETLIPSAASAPCEASPAAVPDHLPAPHTP